jgi:hypothetical protein
MTMPSGTSDDRAWRNGEGLERYLMKPNKIEVIKGKLLCSAEERQILLGLLPLAKLPR